MVITFFYKKNIEFDDYFFEHFLAKYFSLRNKYEKLLNCPLSLRIVMAIKLNQILFLSKMKLN